MTTHVETCFRLLIQSVIIFHFVPLLTKSERLQLWVESTHGALRHAVWLNMCWTLLKLTASSRLIRRRREATCGKHRTAEIPCCKWLTVILKFISGWPPQSWGLATWVKSALSSKQCLRPAAPRFIINLGNSWINNPKVNLLVLLRTKLQPLAAVCFSNRTQSHIKYLNMSESYIRTLTVLAKTPWITRIIQIPKNGWFN